MNLEELPKYMYSTTGDGGLDIYKLGKTLEVEGKPLIHLSKDEVIDAARAAPSVYHPLIKMGASDDAKVAYVVLHRAFQAFEGFSIPEEEWMIVIYNNEKIPVLAPNLLYGR